LTLSANSGVVRITVGSASDSMDSNSCGG